MNAGYFEEAQHWRDWLTRAVAGKPEQLRVMYGVAGERRLTEWEVDWLPGYEQSLPVRIGNAAYDQLQLDVFGEVMDTLHQGRCGGLSANEAGWDVQIALLDHLAKVWRDPDHGIWEVRTRADALHLLQGDVLGGVRPRAEKRRDVRPARPDARPGASCAAKFTTTYAATAGTRSATPSRAPTAQAISMRACCCSRRSASSSRTIRAIAAPSRRSSASLLVDGLVLRYDSLKSKDGLPPGEGAFLACSFWLADAYLMLGRRDDAEKLFRRLVGLCNDVGLLAEEYDPRARRQLGNFPQAFSHVALLNTAFNLTRADKPAEQRADLPKGTAKSAEAASRDSLRQARKGRIGYTKARRTAHRQRCSLLPTVCPQSGISAAVLQKSDGAAAMHPLLWGTI